MAAFARDYSRNYLPVWCPPAEQPRWREAFDEGYRRQAGSLRRYVREAWRRLEAGASLSPTLDPYRAGLHCVRVRLEALRQRVGQVIATSRRSGFPVVSTEYDARDSRLGNRAHAHRAGFERHVQDGGRKTVVAGCARCLSQRDDLRMRRRVVIQYGTIMPSADDVAAGDDDRADRHLAGCLGFAGFLERLLHAADVFLRPVHRCRDPARREQGIRRDIIVIAIA